MSWVITRKKGKTVQMYCDEDIYGRGKWLGNGEGGYFSLPVVYTAKAAASIRMDVEKNHAPEWTYSVDFYDR